jgi:hypothetical protein
MKAFEIHLDAAAGQRGLVADLAVAARLLHDLLGVEMVNGFFRICVRLPTRTVGTMAVAVVSSPSAWKFVVSALPSASSCHSS